MERVLCARLALDVRGRYCHWLSPEEYYSLGAETENRQIGVKLQCDKTTYFHTYIVNIVCTWIKKGRREYILKWEGGGARVA